MKSVIQITILLLLMIGCGREAAQDPARGKGGPTAVREKIIRARKHLAAGRVREADGLFREAWEEDRGSDAVAAGLCRIALLSGRNGEAIRWGEEAVRINPTLAETWEDLGKGQARQNRFEDAVWSFRKATQLDPDNAAYHNELGVALGKLNIYNEAITAFTRAVSLQPHYPEALNNLGMAYFQMDDPREAEKWLQKAIQFKPDYAKGYLNLGIIYSQQPDHDRAIKSLKKHLSLIQI